MGIIRQFGATPATPSLLFVSAAATPAHKVPWPPPGLRSSGVFVLLMTSRRSATGTYLFTRSGWSKSHPESTMAMTTVALPCRVRQRVHGAAEELRVDRVVVRVVVPDRHVEDAAQCDRARRLAGEACQRGVTVVAGLVRAQ